MESNFKYDRAMVIDDSELDNYVSKVTIETAQFAKGTYVHTTAKSALEFLVNLGKTRQLDSSIFPQVIFVDLNMPEMDGFQFLHYYKSFVETYSLRTKIVVLTSSIRSEDEYRVKAIDPAIIYVRKPITIEKLSEI